MRISYDIVEVFIITSPDSLFETSTLNNVCIYDEASYNINSKLIDFVAH